MQEHMDDTNKNHLIQYMQQFVVFMFTSY